MRIVSEKNPEQVVEFLVQQYQAIQEIRKGKEIDDEFRRNLLEMLAKSFVAYSALMRFDINETLGAICKFRGEFEAMCTECDPADTKH